MDETNWIGGRDLSHIGLSVFTTATDLRDWLILRLGKGHVSARATATVVRQKGSAPPQRWDGWIIPPGAWAHVERAMAASRPMKLADDLTTLAGIFPPNIEEFPYWPQEFECTGLSYSRADLAALLGPTAPSSRNRASRKGIGGAKPDKPRWEEFAAAFALIADSDGIDPDLDEQALFNRIDSFLEARGIDDGLHIDSVRDAIGLAQAWKRGAQIKRPR